MSIKIGIAIPEGNIFISLKDENGATTTAQLSPKQALLFGDQLISSSNTLLKYINNVDNNDDEKDTNNT